MLSNHWWGLEITPRELQLPARTMASGITIGNIVSDSGRGEKVELRYLLKSLISLALQNGASKNRVQKHDTASEPPVQLRERASQQASL